jgi:hypothetical protein
MSGLLIMVLFVSCGDDDPLAPEIEHFEAIGLAVFSSGIQVASILRGVTTDTLHAPEGGLSDHYEVQFYDEDENLIDPPDDPEWSFGWEIGDTLIAEVFQHAGEEGAFEFHLRGLEEGQTTIEFMVIHGDHADYRSGEFPLVVEHDHEAHGEPIGIIFEDEETGTELARAYVVGNANANTGTLTVANGAMTDHIEVVFFDENDVEFSPEVPEHSLGVSSANTGIVTITGQEAEEPWAFKLEGESVGSTTITVLLYHEGAVEATFKPVAVTVN